VGDVDVDKVDNEGDVDNECDVDEGWRFGD
jgi:hypothetical protein